MIALAARAHVLIEGFWPGVAERLGVGPDECTAVNGRLVYARMTGWGQDGPLAQRAGHDINYISVTWALAAIGRVGQPPTVPLNLLGDYGGGSMLILVGILAARWEWDRSDVGQVVDAAMVHGVNVLSQLFWSLRAQGRWQDEPGANLLDGGAPFYEVYPCADGKHVALGALEPKFYAGLLDGLGLTGASLPPQYDRSGWPRLRAAFTAVLGKRPRDEWAEMFADRDACVSPVLSFAEAADHPHIIARAGVIEVTGVPQSAPAPRFSRTPPVAPTPPAQPGREAGQVLIDWGVGAVPCGGSPPVEMSRS